jgi:hypothetical protein
VVLHPLPHVVAGQTRLRDGTALSIECRAFRARLINPTDGRHHLHGIVIYPRRFPLSS